MGKQPPFFHLLSLLCLHAALSPPLTGSLRSQVLNQFLQRDCLKNSRELRPIISYNADVIDNSIVDLPLSTCEMKLVSDFDWRPSAANNPCADFRRFSICPVAVVNYFLASIRPESAHI